MVRETIADRLGSTVRESGLDPLRLTADDWSWQSHDGEPGVVLAADGFEIFRAVTSRRTPDQLRAMVTSGDVGPYLDAFGGLGDLPEQALPE